MWHFIAKYLYQDQVWLGVYWVCIWSIMLAIWLRRLFGLAR